MVIHWLKAFTIPCQHTFCITRTLEKVMLPQPATTTSRLTDLEPDDGGFSSLLFHRKGLESLTRLQAQLAGMRLIHGLIYIFLKIKKKKKASSNILLLLVWIWQWELCEKKCQVILAWIFSCCLCINNETEMPSGVLFCFEPGPQFTLHCPCTAWICMVQLDWYTLLVYQPELYLGCKLCNVGLALEWDGERSRFMRFDCDLKKVQAWEQIPVSAQVLATYEQVE